MRAEGVFDVDANTSIDQLSEDLNIKMPEVCHFFYLKCMHFTYWSYAAQANTFLMLPCFLHKFGLNHGI